MWTVASTTSQLGTLFTDTGTILLYVIGTILTAAIALVGLAFGWKKLKKYVTGGGKF